jgi:hypothetical protein
MAALAPESLGETGGCQDLSYDSSLLFRCAVVHCSYFSDRLGRTAKTPSHDPDTDFCVCLTTALKQALVVANKSRLTLLL